MFKVIRKRNQGESIMTEERACDRCGSQAGFSRSCGVFICYGCGEHEGLARCFCGWPQGRGLSELREMGENVDDDEGFDDVYAPEHGVDDD